MTRHIHLAPHLSVDELAGQYRATKDPIERSRWHFLWLLARGLTAKVIAGITGYSAYWIGQIARRYNQQGSDGVKDRRRQTRPGKRLLTAAQQEEVLEALGRPAPQHDRWNGRIVAEWIAHQLERPVCRQLGWIYLRRLGARLCVPRPRHVDADSQAQADFKQRLRPRHARGGHSVSPGDRRAVGRRRTSGWTGGSSCAKSGRCPANDLSPQSSIGIRGATSLASCTPPLAARCGIWRRP